MNNTEFGLYFLKYHSRTPFLSAIKGKVTSVLTGGPLGTPAQHTGTARYFAEYPEDIRLYGVSFNTAGPMGVALQGEFSYRPNQPLQYNGAEVILASLGAANLITGFTQLATPTIGATAAALVLDGTTIQGWTRVKASQFQMTGTKGIPNVLGSDQMVLVGEVGYTRYSALPTGQKFSGPATNLPATPLGALAGAPFAAYSQQTDGYTTENSWGYRLVGRMVYSNLMYPPIEQNIIPAITTIIENCLFMLSVALFFYCSKLILSS